jgi:hypothetical protein
MLYNNSQEIFIKEDEVGVPEITYKTAFQIKSTSNSRWTDESNNPLKR